MRAVVSGGTGFLGRQIVTGLQMAGYAVSNLSRQQDSRDTTGVQATISTDRSPEDIVEKVCAATPDVIVHLAATGGAATSPSEFGEIFRTNVELGAVLLECAASLSSQSPVSFIATGSFWQRELTGGVVHPNSLYAATKDALEAIANYFSAERGVSCTFLQLSDVYGPSDARGRLIAALARSARSQSPLEMSPGEQVVSFVHVSDVRDAIMQIVTSRSVAKSGARSVGPNHYSVHGPETGPLKEIVAQLSRKVGVDIPVLWGARPYRENEVMNPQFLDLPPGWSPRISLAKGFLEMLESIE